MNEQSHRPSSEISRLQQILAHSPEQGAWIYDDAYAANPDSWRFSGRVMEQKVIARRVVWREGEVVKAIVQAIDPHEARVVAEVRLERHGREVSLEYDIRQPKAALSLRLIGNGREMGRRVLRKGENITRLEKIFLQPDAEQSFEVAFSDFGLANEKRSYRIADRLIQRLAKLYTQGRHISTVDMEETADF